MFFGLPFLSATGGGGGGGEGKFSKFYLKRAKLKNISSVKYVTKTLA